MSFESRRAREVTGLYDRDANQRMQSTNAIDLSHLKTTELLKSLLSSFCSYMLSLDEQTVLRCFGVPCQGHEQGIHIVVQPPLRQTMSGSCRILFSKLLLTLAFLPFSCVPPPAPTCKCHSPAETAETKRKLVPRRAIAASDTMVTPRRHGSTRPMLAP